MKNILVVLIAAAVSCCSPKKNVTGNTSDNVEQATPDMSTCLKKLIDQFKTEEVQNPPRKIYSYSYKGETVYYVTAPCCDFFSDLYDSNCKLIAHPDGGLTGKGDGKAADFVKVRTGEKLVWEDKRKN